MARELVYTVDTVLAVSITSRLVLVTATGTTRTLGWKGGKLDPFMYIMPPADGYQEFNFTATPPTGGSGNMIAPIAAEYTWINPPKWLKGVRIYSETNKKNAKLIKVLKSHLAAAPKKAAAKKKSAAKEK